MIVLLYHTQTHAHKHHYSFLQIEESHEGRKSSQRDTQQLNINNYTYSINNNNVTINQTFVKQIKNIVRNVYAYYDVKNMFQMDKV